MNASHQQPSLSGGAFSLDHFLRGEHGTITAIETDVELRQRLAALGLRAGATFQVLRKAGLGGPIHVRVGTTEVIMRLNEAKRIKAASLVNDLAAP